MSDPTPSYGLACEDLSIGELLSGRYAFQLPPFQRAYAWDVEAADHLIDDILAAIDDRARDVEHVPYFLGTMLFSEPEEGQPIRAQLVVDGQQRLTTLTILLAVLRDHTGDAGARMALHRRIAVWSSGEDWQADAFHLVLRPQDQWFMAGGIQKLSATRRPRRQATLAPKNDAQERIDAVRRHFQRRFGRNGDADLRARVAQFVVNDCRVLMMRTASLDYAYQIFLTINGRGMPLTDDDIVIAEVIGPLDAQQRARFAPILAQMDRYREASERKRLRGKTFFSHLVALSGWGRQSIIRDLRRAVQASGGPAHFTTRVFQPMAEAYLLTRCDFSAVLPPPPVVEALQRLLLLELICDDEWVGVAMLGLTRIDLGSAALIGFLDRLDRYAHVQLVLRSGRDDRRKRYRKIAQAISHDGQLDPDVLFAVPPGDQRRMITKCAFGLNDTVNRTEKAILIRLDAEISGRPIAPYMELFDDDEEGVRTCTVEHVLPKGQRLPRESGWRDTFPDHEHRRAVAQSIGNLVLVSDDQNRRAAQHDFPQKQAVYFPNEAPHFFATTDMLRGLDRWTSEVIQARHDRLMGKLLAVFDLDGPTPAFPMRAGERGGKKRGRGVKRSPRRRGKA